MQGGERCATEVRVYRRRTHANLLYKEGGRVRPGVRGRGAPGPGVGREQGIDQGEAESVPVESRRCPHVFSPVFSSVPKCSPVSVVPKCSQHAGRIEHE